MPENPNQRFLPPSDAKLMNDNPGVTDAMLISMLISVRRRKKKTIPTKQYN
jgi:hypothetical protein